MLFFFRFLKCECIPSEQIQLFIFLGKEGVREGLMDSKEKEKKIKNEF